jgi:hypothetical protein
MHKSLWPRRLALRRCLPPPPANPPPAARPSPRSVGQSSCLDPHPLQLRLSTSTQWWVEVRGVNLGVSLAQARVADNFALRSCVPLAGRICRSQPWPRPVQLPRPHGRSTKSRRWDIEARSACLSHWWDVHAGSASRVASALLFPLLGRVAFGFAPPGCDGGGTGGLRTRFRRSPGATDARDLRP